MKQTAKIIAVNGGEAMVEVRRTSACSECARRNNCFACKSIITTAAQNDIGAKNGDIVTVETPSARILGYAAAVFVMPLAAGIFCFYILSLFTKSGAALYIIPASLFALLFALVCIYLNRQVKKKPDIKITAVIRRADNKTDEEG